MPAKGFEIPDQLFLELKKKSYIPKSNNGAGTIQADWDAIRAILNDRQVMSEVFNHYAANGQLSITAR